MEWGLAFKILEQGLRLWNTKEGRKYLDQMISLKNSWHQEYQRSDRSQMALDKIEREIKILAEAFTSIPRE